MPKDIRSPYDRLNSVRQRLEALSDVQPALKLQKQNSVPTAVISAPEPQTTPALDQALKAAAYDIPLEAETGTVKRTTHAPNDRAFRQMSHYFDYSAYAEQCASGKPKPKVKLNPKQVDSMKKIKQKKKMEKWKDWLYND